MSSRKATEDDDVFHFVSYIHFKNNIYELDGMREGPILIAENVSNSEWIEKIKPAILNRISLYANNEIKFNLLAMVPNRLLRAIDQEKEIQARCDYILKLLNIKREENNSNNDVEVIIKNNRYLDEWSI
jgi:ubiquitin carboxyl-terminal hydrolase L5